MDEKHIGKGRARGRNRNAGFASPPGDKPLLGAGEPAATIQSLQDQKRATTRGNEISDSSPITALEQLRIAVAPPKTGKINQIKKRQHYLTPKTEGQVTVHTKPRDLSSKRGKSGKLVELTANYFKLESITTWNLYQYRVDFSPEEDMNSIKQKLVRIHKNTIGAYIFDGTLLFTSSALPKDPLTLISLRQEDDTKVVITIRLVGTVSAGEYHYCHFFNILMRRCLEALNLQLVGRNYFDAESNIPVPNFQLELWPGYITSIRQHEDEILLCTEITHKVMRKDNAFDILESIAEKCPTQFQVGYKKLILGATVLTGYNNKTYRVDDVDFKVSPLSVFVKDGKNISYKDYYKTRYGIDIRNSNQPMLISLPKLRERRRGFSTAVYLVPELCRMTGINNEMRSDFQLMRALAHHTRLTPNERIANLHMFQDRLCRTEKIANELKQWGLSLGQELVTVPGRVLMPEQIKVGRDQSFHSGSKNNWSREISYQPLLTAPVLREWGLIIPINLIRTSHSFISTLTEAATKMHFCIKPPHVQEVFDDQTTSYMDGIESIIRMINPELLMVVLPTQRTDRYNAIKKRGCVDLGIPTQIVLAKTMQGKNLRSIAVKIAVQICCKIGGAPWTVSIPLSDVMVVGFDVYHEATLHGITIGALVATMNKDVSQYFSTVSYLRAGEEMSSDLTTNIVKALRQYNRCNNCLPKCILLYRDGIGEGQVGYVFDQEVGHLRKKLREIYGDNECKLAYIIITKRLNTRLFYNNDNPPPGTVVDSTITLPQRYDFYLVSQSVHQGTVSPTSYNVISDNIGLEPDQLQRLTYKFTHLYYNWNGTVRVPAPVQYAHKLAFLVGQNLHKIPNPVLDNQLYFL